MVYYEGTDIFEPEDKSPPPSCDDDAFQDRSSCKQGLEFEAQYRSQPDAEIVHVSHMLPDYHNRPALTATGGKYGRKREFYVKRLPNGTVTNK